TARNRAGVPTMFAISQKIASDLMKTSSSRERLPPGQYEKGTPKAAQAARHPARTISRVTMEIGRCANQRSSACIPMPPAAATSATRKGDRTGNSACGASSRMTRKACSATKAAVPAATSRGRVAARRPVLRSCGPDGARSVNRGALRGFHHRGAKPQQEDTRRAGEDPQVEPQRPMLDVVEVVTHLRRFFRERVGVGVADLRPA